MQQAKFSVGDPDGFWKEISVKYPQLSFKVKNWLNLDKKTTCFLTISGDKTEEFLKDLKKKFKDLEILQSSGNKAYVKYNISNQKTITRQVIKNACFFLEPMEIKKGKLVFLVGATEREAFSGLYNDLQPLGIVKIIYIKESEIKTPLTVKQEQILQMARELGYYEWPRKISVQELAKRLNLSKSTFIEHLRKAESKILQG